MQLSTSTDWPRARGSGRRITRRKVISVSPLGRVRSSAGAESRPRSRTSLRSITATLMQRASPPRCRRPRAAADLWTPPTGVDDRGRPPFCELLLALGTQQVGVGHGQPQAALVGGIEVLRPGTPAQGVLE